MKNKKKILMALMVTIALVFTACGTAVNDKQEETETTSTRTSTMDTDKKSDTKDKKKSDQTDSKKAATEKTEKKSSDDKKTAETNKKSDSKSSKQPASEKNTQTEKPSSGTSGNKSSNQTPSNNGNHNSDNGTQNNAGNSQNNNSGSNNADTNPPETSHSHNYSASVTSQPTCSANGNRTYTCACTSSYDESIPATGSHNWQSHDATGHNENVLISAAWDEPTYANRYVCNTCNGAFDNDGAIAEHMAFTDCENYRVASVQTGSVHHDAVYENQWKQDSAAYSDCSTCGTRK